MNPPAANKAWKLVTMAALGVYWPILFTATHVPGPPDVLGTSDKVQHFGAYGLLAFLVALAWSQWRSLGWRQFAIVLGIVAAYGIFDELSQIPMGRTGDPVDWLADMAGAISGLAAFAIVRALWRAAVARQIFGVGGR